MNAVGQEPKDTAVAAPQSDAPPVEIEIVDTPDAPEGGTPAAPAAEPPLIFGKFRTPEDAEKAYQEAQRAMHEKAAEAAAYRKMLEERQAQPATPPYQQTPVNMDEQFREKLAENPGAVIFEAARFAAKQMLEEQQNAQRELVKKYQAFSSRPEYADVAQEVASQLPFAQEKPIDPIEGMFLRARLAKLEAAMAGGAVGNPNVPFVEPAGGARRPGGNGSLRVELDPDTAKLRALGTDKIRDLARLVAKQKAVGGSMSGMSIDDWEKANA